MLFVDMALSCPLLTLCLFNQLPRQTGILSRV